MRKKFAFVFSVCLTHILLGLFPGISCDQYYQKWYLWWVVLRVSLAGPRAQIPGQDVSVMVHSGMRLTAIEYIGGFGVRQITLRNGGEPHPVR